MRPEVVGAFRLAMKHEETAGTVFWSRRRRWLTAREKKHSDKAQKLYDKARRLEARGIR